jgi:diguanylate cyclase (GGDEF)-like protein
VNEYLRALRTVAAPAAVILVATLAAWLGPPLPDSLAGVRVAGPYTLLTVGVALAFWFNRGRSFVILASLLAAFAGYHVLPSKAVYTALSVLVPLNALLAFILPERGSRYRAAYGWMALLFVEILFVAWIGSAGQSSLAGTSWDALLEHWSLRSPPTPLLGRLMFAAAFACAVWRAWPDFTPLAVGNAGALVAFFIAAQWAGQPAIFALFMSAAGAILVIALLQESYQLAFRDQLTGLPGRRALEERLRSLGPRYVIAMVDVDHFKKFNDTHGHDVGDQVLKLVGARLAEIKGGGVAYRYGGEEFSVLFPERGLREALAPLDDIRRTIEEYRMAVRSDDRPKKTKEGEKKRGAKEPQQRLSVTVSVGAAEPTRENVTPAQVMKAADDALYRAKQGGRNRVSL